MSTKSLPPLPNPVEQPTMAVEVAAGYLGISRPAAYAAARSGELPTVRIGRRLLVPTAALRRLLEIDE